MTEGSRHGSSVARLRLKKPILRAHMTALARRLYGPERSSALHRGLAASILQVRRRSLGR
jgi:hypothetical protein